jgi:hypothetical protein
VTAGSLTVAEEQGYGRGTCWQALTHSDLATEDGSPRLLRPEQRQRLTIKVRLVVSRQQQKVRRYRMLRWSNNGRASDYVSLGPPMRSSYIWDWCN